MSLKYISLFSGIEAASVAWKPLGWTPIAFSEIEPFPCCVLKHHYPNVPNVGDITKADWSQYAGTADVVVGGSPCQSFSVAGLRQGMDDPRGNLMLEYLRAVSQIAPRWIVWENVPGVLSDQGNAFGVFLRALAELGYGFAWRVLDAQFFGVAQRRRRVYVIGHTGGDWRSASSVLFERQSLFRDYPTGKAARKAAARNHRQSSKSTNVYAIQGHIIGRSPSNGGNGLGFSAGNEPTPTLTATDVHAVAGAVVSDSYVRRLMTVECERLQGFPDGYTDVTYRGKPAPDSPRYKALGNSMAVPVMRWIGVGIQTVEKHKETTQ